MTQLVKIGNSQGIRIPKPLVDQASLSGKELKLQVVGDGLLITPVKKARQDWKEAVENAVALQEQQAVSSLDTQDSEWLDAPLSVEEDDNLEW